MGHLLEQHPPGYGYANQSSYKIFAIYPLNLLGEVNGYFVQVGGENDSIGLFRQQGLNVTQIIGSTIAYTGNSTNVLQH